MTATPFLVPAPLVRLTSCEDTDTLDFARMKAAAIAEIQARCGAAGWTDFNVHDPGVTLLEACLWAIADLHYRTATLAFGGAPVDLDDPSVLAAPGHADAGSVAFARELALDRLPELVDTVVGALCARALEGPGAACHEAVRAWAGGLAAADDRRPGTTADVVHALVRRAWRYVNDEAMPDVPVDPAAFEHPDGRSRIWPPHPSQLVSATPVTARDYREHVRASLEASGHGSQAVWVTSGAVAGMRWDGTAHDLGDPDRPGALSILVGSSDDPKLVEHARQAIAGCGPGRSHSWWGQADFVAADAGAGARRALCDDVYVGVVRRCPVDVMGEVLPRSGRHPSGVQAQIAACVGRFFADAHGDRWAPGTLVSADMLADAIKDLRDVETVAWLDVAIRDVEVGSSGRGEDRLPPFAVPVLGELRIGLVDYDDGARR